MLGLQKRSAPVTAAPISTGATVAMALAGAGTYALVADGDTAAETKLAERVVAGGGKAKCFPFEVRNRANACRAVRPAAALGGRTPTRLIDKDGPMAPDTSGAISEVSFCRVVDVRVSGHFMSCHAALARLRVYRKGRTIDIASGAGVQETIAQVNDGAAKAAVIGPAKFLTRARGRRKLMANAIAPHAATAVAANTRTNEKPAAQTAATIPLGRRADTEQVAGTFVFLASGAAPCSGLKSWQSIEEW